MTQLIVTAEQTRYRHAGGIAAYVTGLREGVSEYLHGDQTLQTTFYESHLPVRALTKLWAWGVPTFMGGDVVHSTSLRLPPTKRPLIVTVHDLLWKNFPETFPEKAIAWHDEAFEEAKRRAVRFIVPSQQTAHAMSNEGVNPTKISVIPHGADHLAPPDFAATDALLRKSGIDKPFVLSVGTLEPRKNLTGIVNAVRKASADHGETIPIVLAGPRGWSKEDLKNHDVKTVGNVAPGVLAGLYQRAKLFVYAPLGEGFGFPPLEAMRSGTATIVSPVPSVTDGALIVDPLSVDEMGHEIWKLWRNDAARLELAAAGEAYARKFTWYASAREHVRVWREVAAL